MEISVLHKCSILVLDDYPRQTQLKNELCDSLEKYPDLQNKTTNVKATMTEWNITSPEIEILKNNIMQNSNTLLWRSERFEVVNFWANIYRKNEHTIKHDHRPMTLSFVYFLKSKNNFSPLIFDTFWKKKKIKPKEGRLVIFPSYLVHSVPAHRHDDVRITLAGDIGSVY